MISSALSKQKKLPTPVIYLNRVVRNDGCAFLVACSALLVSERILFGVLFQQTVHLEPSRNASTKHYTAINGADITLRRTMYTTIAMSVSSDLTEVL